MPSPAPDGGFWGWTAVLACFMCNLICDGVMYSLGVFIPIFKIHFNAGSGEVSAIYSLMMGVNFGAGPLSSLMTHKLGWRITTVIGSILASASLAISSVAPSVLFLYLSLGGCLGLGLGMVYLTCLDCVTQYFDKKRPFATGIAICGSGLGTFIFAPLIQWLIDRVGWQLALVILSAICLFNCCFGLLFKPLPAVAAERYKVADSNGERTLLNKHENVEVTEEKETMSDMFSLLCHTVFMLFAISNFLTSLGYPIPYSFVPDNARSLGLDPTQGSFLVGLIGIINTISRLFLGIISQFLNRLYLYNTCLVICGTSMALANYFQPILETITSANCTIHGLPPSSPFEAEAMNCTLLDKNFTSSSHPSDILPWSCSQWVGQLMFIGLYGVTSAAYVLLTTLVLADLLGKEKFTNAFGLLLLFQGVATMVGPPIVGLIYDSTCRYHEGFLLMGTAIALSGLMLYPVPYIQKWTVDKQAPTKEKKDTLCSGKDGEDCSLLKMRVVLSRVEDGNESK